MSTMDVARQMRAEGLAHAKRMVDIRYLLVVNRAG